MRCLADFRETFAVSRTHMLSDELVTSVLNEFVIHGLARLSLPLSGRSFGQYDDTRDFHKGISSHFLFSERQLISGQNLAADYRKISDHQYQQLKLKWKMNETLGLASGVPLESNCNLIQVVTALLSLLVLVDGYPCPAIFV